MKIEEMVAIPCTRRAARELVDGTLRVQIDIEPMYKKRFMDLMGDMDILLAVVPINYAPVPDGTPSPPPAMSSAGFKDYGRLAQSAILVCKELRFQQFVSERWGDGVVSEKNAGDYIKHRCKVASRKHIDTTDGGGTRYGALMAEFREWQELHPERPPF